MTPLEQQFEILRNDRIGTSLQKLPDGSHLVIVPDVMLPTGWSKSTVVVKFVASWISACPPGLFLDGLRFAIIEWQRTPEHGADSDTAY